MLFNSHVSVINIIDAMRPNFARLLTYVHNRILQKVIKNLSNIWHLEFSRQIITDNKNYCCVLLLDRELKKQNQIIYLHFLIWRRIHYSCGANSELKWKSATYFEVSENIPKTSDKLRNLKTLRPYNQYNKIFVKSVRFLSSLKYKQTQSPFYLWNQCSIQGNNYTFT